MKLRTGSRMVNSRLPSMRIPGRNSLSPVLRITFVQRIFVAHNSLNEGTHNAGT